VTVQIAHLYGTACLAIVFFQIALIAGAPLGRYTQGGTHDGALPMSGRIIALVSIPVVLFQGLAILSAAGFPGLGWPTWTGWVAFAVQVVSTVLNWITPSKPERAVWGPVMLVMAAMALVVLTA
jgi:cytochrome bd-type quinol oxidase subunit 2